MTEPDWDEERLDAAFRSRFDRQAPSGLEGDVHARIAGTSPARFTLLRFRPGLGLAAVVAVVILVGTLAVGAGGFGARDASPQPSGSSVASSPGANPTATEQALPGVVVGLPIIHVQEAIAIRDAGTDDRELAVMGWFVDAALAGCPAPTTPAINPLQVTCPDRFVWLMEDAESLVHRAGNETDTTSPSGPALNPDLDGVDRSWEPPGNGFDASGASTPVDVVFVGHFDDRRASTCPEAEQAACRDRFVVDSVAFVHGRPVPLTVVSDLPQGDIALSQADVEAIVANEAPGSPILSMVVTDGADGLATMEPSLRAGQEALTSEPVVWVVRVLDTDRISTYLIRDGTDEIYEMNPDGQPIFVGATPSDPSARPWPEPGAILVTVTTGVDVGKVPVQVAVVDKSGRLLAAKEKGSIDPRTMQMDGTFLAYAEPGAPGRVHLAWVGGICDSQITVTVAADLGSITFDMGPQPGNCDSIGILRQLVLDFDGTVDVSAIKVRDAAGVATPSASAPAYTLECGPLGPDTCGSKAAAVVSAKATESPTKRIASLTFTDECGSYTVIFDDGTGLTASVDCVLP